MPGDTVYPRALEEIIGVLTRLPGIGRRTAERLALALLSWEHDELAAFGQRIAGLREDVLVCRECGNLADEPVCRICRDPRRDRHQICIVEQATQIPVIEQTGCYKGLYHVLGGRLDPLEDIGPDELRIHSLHRRIAEEHVTELILATSSDVEGEATAAYLVDEFRDAGLQIARIASGVPVGADLAYADSATIATAMRNRVSV